MLARRNPLLPRRTLFALAAGTLLVAGCSNPSGPSAPTGPLPDAQQLQSQAAAYTKAQASAHVVVTVTGTIADFPLQKLEGDLANKPQTIATGHLSAKIGGAQLVEGDFRVLEDGHLWANLFGPWQDFGDAAKALNGYQVSDILSPEKGIGNLVGSIQHPTAEGREQVGGVNTVKIKGKVSPDALRPLYPGAKQDVDATAWIQEDGSHQLVRTVVEVSPGNTINVDPTKWGETFTVAKPA
ncbi:MAG: LppX_LprAFG lipoprotein [Segniliparus sp.]|uniref:LppX_LprAFG lipoprotein n=1 Tax=Segniliparus sp. TaxID=2804064 RepID=UPI003F3F096D